MLTLLPDERTWLDRYREAIRKECPDAVRDLLIYGSKARGDAHEDSDIDMLVIVKKGHDHVKNRLTDMADDLAVAANAAPSTIALTEDEWGRMKELRLPFQRNVERDAVSVLSDPIEERGRARKTHGKPGSRRTGSEAARTGGKTAEEHPMNKEAVLTEWGNAPSRTPTRRRRTLAFLACRGPGTEAGGSGPPSGHGSPPLRFAAEGPRMGFRL